MVMNVEREITARVQQMEATIIRKMIMMNISSHLQTMGLPLIYLKEEGLELPKIDNSRKLSTSTERQVSTFKLVHCPPYATVREP